MIGDLLVRMKDVGADLLTPGSIRTRFVYSEPHSDFGEHGVSSSLWVERRDSNKSMNSLFILQCYKYLGRSLDMKHAGSFGLLY